MTKNRFLITLVLPMILLFFSAMSQDKTVTGKVTGSKDGLPLDGVAIKIKGGKSGTQTQADGTFKIIVPNGAQTLEVSFVGYAKKEVPVSNQFLAIVLDPVNTNLNEVVVIGYGTQKKKDLTGSVAVISEKDFNEGPIVTPEQLITGKVAGVQITSNSGAPGSGSTIRIRGGASLIARNDPLIVIDGVPMDNSTIMGSANPLSFVNPNDIESFNILKDASATAIYGSRASNGVVIITTKKGKGTDKLKVNFNTLASVSKVYKTVDVLSATDFRKVVNGKASDTQKKLMGNADTDWQRVIYQNAFSFDNNISLTGTIKKVPYRVSLGYLDQDGILKTDNLKRASAGINLSPKFFNNYLKVDLNLKGSMNNSFFANTAAIGAAVAFDPTQAVYANNVYGGYFEWLDPSTGLPNTVATGNPLSLLEQTHNKGEVTRSLGNIQFDYKLHFLPDLRANLNLGYDVSKSKGTNYTAPTAASAFVRGGIDNEYSQKRQNKLLEFYLNYNKQFDKIKSRIDVTAGYSYQDFLNDVPSYPDLNVKGDTINPAPVPFKTQNTLISVFGRMNYVFDDRYLFTATVRRDGSSRFSEANRWGTFPSLAFAWKMKEENFLKRSSVVSDLKLRVGYGVTGQQDLGNLAGALGDYAYLARYTISDPTAMYQLGKNFYNTLRPEGYDENIKWEETQTFNAGVDFGFFNGRLSGSVEAYYKKTKDLLNIIPIPAGSNLTNQVLTNVGNIDNKGLELTVNVRAIEGKDFTWNIGANASYNQNKITKLSKVNDPGYLGVLVGGLSGGVGNTIQIQSVGYPANSFFVFKQLYDKDHHPLEGKYEDINKDLLINDKDKYRYKSPNPLWFLGFNTQATYKKWTMSLAMRSNIGNYMYNNVHSNNGTYKSIVNSSGFLSNVSPNLLATNFESNQYFSDYYIENASFVRMDNINLEYNIGKIIRGKVGMRVSANVQNVFVITNYSGLDPEIQGGIDNNFYPRPRVYSLGANLNF